MLMKILRTVMKENLVLMIMVMQLYRRYHTQQPMIQIAMKMKTKILMQQNQQLSVKQI